MDFAHFGLGRFVETQERAVQPDQRRTATARCTLSIQRDQELLATTKGRGRCGLQCACGACLRGRLPRAAAPGGKVALFGTGWHYLRRAPITDLQTLD
jgi:hypothetical protein